MSPEQIRKGCHEAEVTWAPQPESVTELNIRRPLAVALFVHRVNLTTKEQNKVLEVAIEYAEIIAGLI